MESLEPEHWPRDPLYETVILFQNIVEVFDLQNFDGLACAGEFQDDIYRLQSGQVGTTFVYDDPVRDTVPAERLFEKPPGSSQIPVRRQYEIKGLAVTINGTAEI